jgi:tetratricopeptide (TPR) repeat protein
MEDVHNEIAGAASGVVQAGVVHGGVHITASHTPPAIVPHQLPAPGHVLTGRAALLQQLDNSLLPRGFAVLSGMAGVGKTALVLHWAENNAAAFPDGQLYLDLHGFGTDEPLSPGDALAGFLRALGHARPEELATVEERAAHFRTLMSDRRTLVVLDNAHSVEHVRPLLPGTGPCSVVVISRHQLRGLALHHPATAVTVGPLAEPDGLALLNRAVGVELDMDAAAQLVRYCGGLPLALRIVAERLADAPDDIHEVVTELVDEGARLDALDTQDDAHSAIRTVFSWSYQRLPAHEARAFRLLGLHPAAEFGTGAAVAMLGLARNAAARTLRSLVQRHLVLSLGRGRFSVHDLLHTYAAEVCESAESTDSRSYALRILFDHYLHSADLAGRLVMPHRLRLPLVGKPHSVPVLNDRQEALRWFEVERRNLEAMCALDDPAFDERIWLLAYTLRDYYFVDKLLDGWRGTHEKALAAAIRAGDPLAEARTRNNLGMALVEAGLLDEAEVHYSRAHRLFEQLGDGHGRANALANLAAVLRRRGRFAEALSNQQLALDWYRAAGANRNIGITLRSMALAEMELERYDDAVQHVQEALDIALALELDVDAAEGFGRLGRIQRRAQNDTAAEVALHRAVHHSRRCGSRHEEARALRLLGDVAAATGRTADARRWWLDALRVYQELGSPDMEALHQALDALSDDQ